MKWMFGKTTIWIIATVGVAAVAFATTQDPQLPEGDGKNILQTACTSCHGLEGVVSLHLDRGGWESLVSEMVSNGAEVAQKDYPVLIDYLVKNFGPAGSKPAGQTQSSSSDADAKKILETVCTACHGLDVVSDEHLSKDEWQGIVSSMVAMGASVTDKEIPILVEYLVRTYGPKK